MFGIDEPSYGDPVADDCPSTSFLAELQTSSPSFFWQRRQSIAHV